jgi:DNA-binding NarL/FixJ family response regulator
MKLSCNLNHVKDFSKMNPTCIIVEDHDGVRNLLCDWLQAVFPAVVFLGTASGEEALRLVHAHEPSVVLMDLGLPGMNGIEATRQIKRAYPQTYVIIHTIYDDSAYREDAALAGANAYVPKSRAQTDLVPILGKVFMEMGLENIRTENKS